MFLSIWNDSAYVVQISFMKIDINIAIVEIPVNIVEIVVFKIHAMENCSVSGGKT